jgi:myo-inositol 2-dehydrogenase/D-chiro-inositol 1-dehydrogenase
MFAGTTTSTRASRPSGWTTAALGVLDLGRHDPLGYDIRAELFGSDDSSASGWARGRRCGRSSRACRPPAGPAWPHFLDRFHAAYAAELATFIACRSGELPSPCTARDGVQAIRIAEAATRSLHAHRPVRLEEIPDS